MKIFPRFDDRWYINLENLHGRMGEQILRTLRNQTVKSDDNIRRVADECKTRILAEKMERKYDGI